jgi:hypothetical protein
VWGSRWSWRVRWEGTGNGWEYSHASPPSPPPAGPLKYEAQALLSPRRGPADRCGGPVMGTHHWRCGGCGGGEQGSISNVRVKPASEGGTLRSPALPPP